MKISYRAHDYGKCSAIELAKRIGNHDFDGVQLAINKAIEGLTAEPGTINENVAIELKEAFNNEKLQITMLGSYFNPVHSNKELVKKNIAKFKEHLKYASYFGTKYVGTETGSFNDDKWTYNPLNRTEEAFNEVKEILSDLLVTAKEYDIYMAIEGADGHCMFEPKHLKRMFDEINNGYMKIIVDTYNYLNIENYNNHTEIFDECIKLFGDDIVIFHLKDFIVQDGKLVQVGLGQGLMNLNYILPKIKEHCPNANLIFEGIKPVDIETSLKLVRSLTD